MGAAIVQFVGNSKNIILPYLLLSIVFLITCWRLPNGTYFGVRLQSSHHITVHMDELSAALKAASMENRTLIISMLNKAYVQENGMLDLFLRSMREGIGTASLIRHLLVIAADEASFHRCSALKLNCYLLPPANGTEFSKEQLFLSDGFLEMMWQRIRFLSTVLKRGYSFVFTDMDILWLRNPFEKLRENSEDLQIGCDLYKGQPLDETNAMNTGFYYVRSNNRTVELFDLWYDMKRNPRRMNDQRALVVMRNEGALQRLGVTVRYLDPRHIAGLCQHGDNMTEITTFHANCCRTMNAKLIDLGAVWDTWKRSTDGAATKWPEPRACSASWRLNITQA